MIYLAAQGIDIREWMTRLMLKLSGDDGLTEYGWRYNKSKSSKRKKGSDQADGEDTNGLMAQIRKTFSIFFPTKETVVNSKGGAPVSPSQCLQVGSADAPSAEEQSAFSRSGIMR